MSACGKNGNWSFLKKNVKIWTLCDMFIFLLEKCDFPLKLIPLLMSLQLKQLHNCTHIR